MNAYTKQLARLARMANNTSKNVKLQNGTFQEVGQESSGSEEQDDYDDGEGMVEVGALQEDDKEALEDFLDDVNDVNVMDLYMDLHSWETTCIAFT